MTVLAGLAAPSRAGRFALPARARAAASGDAGLRTARGAAAAAGLSGARRKPGET
ncbi:hypothetical protein ACU4GD_44940 [Cupriavidus basilensis]